MTSKDFDFWLPPCVTPLCMKPTFCRSLASCAFLVICVRANCGRALLMLHMKVVLGVF